MRWLCNKACCVLKNRWLYTCVCVCVCVFMFVCFLSLFMRPGLYNRKRKTKSNINKRIQSKGKSDARVCQIQHGRRPFCIRWFAPFLIRRPMSHSHVSHKLHKAIWNWISIVICCYRNRRVEANFWERCGYMYCYNWMCVSRDRMPVSVRYISYIENESKQKWWPADSDDEEY